MQQICKYETEPMRRVQSRIGRPLKGFLVERYLEQGRTTTEIAAELGLHAVTITRWLRFFDIEVRFPGQRGPKVVS